MAYKVQSYFGVIGSEKGSGRRERIVIIATHIKNTLLWNVEYVEQGYSFKMDRNAMENELRARSDYIVVGRIV